MTETMTETNHTQSHKQSFTQSRTITHKRIQPLSQLHLYSQAQPQTKSRSHYYLTTT